MEEAIEAMCKGKVIATRRRFSSSSVHDHLDQLCRGEKRQEWDSQERWSQRPPPTAASGANAHPPHPVSISLGEKCCVLEADPCFLFTVKKKLKKNCRRVTKRKRSLSLISQSIWPCLESKESRLEAIFCCLRFSSREAEKREDRRSYRLTERSASISTEEEIICTGATGLLVSRKRLAHSLKAGG